VVSPELWAAAAAAQALVRDAADMVMGKGEVDA
jgi:hypothetical protein